MNVKRNTINIAILLLLTLALVATAILPTAVAAYASSDDTLTGATDQAPTPVVEPSHQIADSTNGNYLEWHNLNDVGIWLDGGYFSVGNKIPLQVHIYSEQLITEALADNTVALDITEDIHNIVNNIDLIANTQYATSDIARFNALASGETTAITDQTADMIKHAQTMYEATNGDYNPAVYRLVDLWGFSSRTYYQNGNLPYDRQWDSNDTDGAFYPLPAQKYIDAFVKLADFGKVKLSGTEGNYTLTKTSDSVVVDGVTYNQWIDLGGIAKGYAVELIAEYLRDNGYDHYYISSGTSSIVMTTLEDGSSFNQAFSEPIKFALFATSYATLPMSNTALSTSGTYERMYRVNGKSYCHIIDGKTGMPASSDLVTISSLGGTAWEADCFTTALTINGSEGIVNYTNNGLHLCYDDGCTELSPNLLALREYSRGRLSIVTNMQEDKFSVINKVYSMGSSLTIDADGNRTLEILEIVNYDYIWLTLCAVIAVVAVVAVVLYRAKHPRNAMTKVDNARKGDIFYKWDIALYIVLVVAILLLFVQFVFTVDTQPYATLEITCVATGEKLFSYERLTGEYDKTNTSEVYRVVANQNSSTGVITVKIYSKYDTGSGEPLNVLTIAKDGTAKMIDSDCGHTQECVKVFGSIKNMGDTIVCSPNSIKVVGK